MDGWSPGGVKYRAAYAANDSQIYISREIMENIIFGKSHLVAEYFHVMQKTDVFVEIHFTRSICHRRLASRKNQICNKTYDETFVC